jgi:hypothetical protein
VTHAAPDGIFYAQPAQSGRGWPGGEQKGLRLRVGLANGPPAKATHTLGRGAAHPAAHLVLGWGDGGDLVAEPFEKILRVDYIHADLAGRPRQGLVSTKAADR